MKSLNELLSSCQGPEFENIRNVLVKINQAKQTKETLLDLDDNFTLYDLPKSITQLSPAVDIRANLDELSDATSEMLRANFNVFDAQKVLKTKTGAEPQRRRRNTI